MYVELSYHLGLHEEEEADFSLLHCGHSWCVFLQELKLSLPLSLYMVSDPGVAKEL